MDALCYKQWTFHSRQLYETSQHASFGPNHTNRKAKNLMYIAISRQCTTLQTAIRRSANNQVCLRQTDQEQIQQVSKVEEMLKDELRVME